MKNQNLKFLVISKSISLFFLVLICLASCQSTRNIPQTIASDEQDGFQKSVSVLEKRKIITSVNLILQVENADTVNQRIGELLEQTDGYTAKMSTERTVIRVNTSQLETTLIKLSALGKVKAKNVYGNDVTDDYRDHEIRLENAEKSRIRYLELLKKANNVQEILLVEKELERLNEVIDLLKGKLKRLSHLSEYATITIDMEVRKKPGLIGYVFVGAYKSVRWLFVRN